MDVYEAGREVQAGNVDAFPGGIPGKASLDRRDLTAANGYIAHRIEAVLAIDYVPAFQDQVVWGFLKSF